ncbi:hypothetical protein PQR34_46530 [Paraburkholderia sediminicola]|uniref:hypothetical protein n=1 Tax=Paraburkholderia sediminicola TaxID=458836 RepID=UPI0038B7D561
MTSFLAFLGTTLSSTAVALAVLAAIGTIFKQAITTWVTKRVAAGLERDAETYRHDLGREMETHKGRLTRDIEGYKSELSRAQDVNRIKVEVRRAVAEQLLVRRLAAIHDLSQALNSVPHAVSVTARSERSPEKFSAVDEKLKSMEATLETHGVYCSNAARGSYAEMIHMLYSLAVAWRQGANVTDLEPHVKEILNLQFKLDAEFQRMLQALPDEIASLVIYEKTQVSQTPKT